VHAQYSIKNNCAESVRSKKKSSTLKNAPPPHEKSNGPSLSSNSIKKSFTNLLNLSFQKGEYLTEWKRANVSPIYKKDRDRNNVPNVPDHSDRQSRLFADQIKIWPIRSICPHFLNMPLNTHLNKKFNFISNSSLNN
jgi:hypothetical protein